MRARKKSIYIGLAVCLPLLLCAAGYTQLVRLLDAREITSDPTEYQAKLLHFDPEYAALAPSTIPASATRTIFEYEHCGGLGPSSQRLDLSFTTTPGEAQRLLAEGKSKVPSWTVAAAPNENEARIESGDRIAVLRVNPTTGEVILHLGDN